MAQAPADITALLDGLGSADLAALTAAGFRVGELRALAATPYGASQVEAVLVCHTSAVGREPTDTDRAAAQTAFRRVGHGPRPDGARDMQAERAKARQTGSRPAGGATGGKPRPERSPAGAWGTAFAVLLVAVAGTLAVALFAGRPAALGVGFLGLLAIGGTALRFPNSTRGGTNIAAGLIVAGLVALATAAVGGPSLGLRYSGTQASATKVDASVHTTSHGGRQLHCSVHAPDGTTVDLKACPGSVTDVGTATVPAFAYVYDPNGHQDPALGAKSDQGTGSQYTLIAAIVVAAALAGLGIARSRPQN